MQNGSAIVTGAASGIGLAITKSLLEKGYCVAMLDKDTETGQKVAGQIGNSAKLIFLACDVSNPREVEDVVQRATARLGHITVLVNNAGDLGPEGYLVSDDDSLAAVLAVNLLGPLYMSKRIISHMKEHGGGRIVNVSSITAIIGSPDYPSYAAAKAGLVGLTKSLARKYARNNIRVNCVCPGSVLDTRLLLRSRGSPILPEERIGLMKKIPIGRALNPSEVAELVIFLVSPGSSGLNGATIVLDGGEMLGL